MNVVIVQCAQKGRKQRQRAQHLLTLGNVPNVIVGSFEAVNRIPLQRVKFTQHPLVVSARAGQAPLVAMMEAALHAIRESTATKLTIHHVTNVSSGGRQKLMLMEYAV